MEDTILGFVLAVLGAIVAIFCIKEAICEADRTAGTGIGFGIVLVCIGLWLCGLVPF